MSFRKPLAERLRLFREDPLNRQQMSRILSDPVMTEAMALLREMYLPGMSIILPSAETTSLSIALKHAAQSGAHDYEAELFRLCDEPEKAETDQPVAGRLLRENEAPPFDPRKKKGRRA